MKVVKPPRKSLQQLSPELAAWWNSIARDERFAAILFHMRGKMNTYAIDGSESPHAHIQSERLGGMRGWLKLESLLLETISEDEISEKPKPKHIPRDAYED